MRWSATNKNGWGKLGADIPRKASAIVRRTAADVQAGAQQRVPVDTGALKNSIQSTMESDLVGVVSVGMEYAAVVEYGSAKSPAQPYLTPAMDAARPDFQAALKKLLDG